ncbi:MAG: hypothetical protein ABFS10_09350 [Bacteroidota bacterium]
MKRLFFVVAAMLLITPLVSGQSNTEEVEYFQAIFGSEKKSIVSEFVHLEGDVKDAFWATYDAYETERKTLGKNRVALLEKYAETYQDMTDEETDEMMASMSKQMKSIDKLIDSYYKKIKKVSGSKAAAQFFHLEHFFLSAIRLSVLESIPVIGELGD